MVFLALEPLFGLLCGNVDDGGWGLAVSVSIAVAAFVAVGGTGGARDGGRCRVLCLGDGILDEARCGGFVDCELACVGSSVSGQVLERADMRVNRYGRLAGSSASLILSKYCRTLSYGNDILEVVLTTK